MLLSCQDKLLPGSSYAEKYVNAAKAGFDSVEINGGGQLPLAQRIEEIKAAAKASGIVPGTVCGGYQGWIADFDERKRQNCLQMIWETFPAMAEIGAVGTIVPAAYGMFSRKLPPFTPPRSEADDKAILIESLSLLGEKAAEYGVNVYLEPLNRYEDHMVNTVAAAVAIVKAVALPSVGVMLDLFHGNIEENDLAAVITANAEQIRHIHLADSNRMQPGTGHLNYTPVFNALKAIDFKGFCALECGVQGEGLEPLVQTVLYLRQFA